MTDIDQIKQDLEAAKQETRSATAAATRANKAYQAARKRENQLLAQLKQAEAVEQPERIEIKLAALREKLAARIAKFSLTFPERDKSYYGARSKGGWETQVNLIHNLELLPPNGQDTWAFLREYNLNQELQDYYEVDDVDDLPDDVKADWEWMARAGEQPMIKLSAWIWHRPTGMDESARLVQQACVEIPLDESDLLKGPISPEQALAAFDAACEKFRAAKLIPQHPQMFAAPELLV